MKRSTLSVILIIITILISGSPGLANSPLMIETTELETKNQSFSTKEGLSLIPHTDTQFLETRDDFYTYNFSAEEGDRVHLRITVTREPYVQVLLIPQNKLNDEHLNYTAIEEKIMEASSQSTKDLKAHVTIPETDDYSLVVRFPTDSHFRTAAGFEIIIGRGLFSSMVVRTGGYLGLVIFSSSLVVVLGTGFYVYKRLKKRSSVKEKTENWQKEDLEGTKKKMSTGSKDRELEDETEGSSDSSEYLKYEN